MFDIKSAIRRSISNKQKAYKLSLQNEMGKEVIADLRIFCNGTKSNFSNDPLQMARMEGRREVFNRVMEFMEVDFANYYDYDETIFDD